MKKKRVHTSWIERDDGLTDAQIKDRGKAIERKIGMAKKKADGEKGSGSKKVKMEKLKPLLEKGGMTAEQLMEALGGVTRLALKNAILKVMIDSKKVYDVPGLYGKAPGNIRFTKFGLRIPTKRLEGHFKKGDEFTFKVEENAIVLNKV